MGQLSIHLSYGASLSDMTHSTPESAELSPPIRRSITKARITSLSVTHAYLTGTAGTLLAVGLEVTCTAQASMT